MTDFTEQVKLGMDAAFEQAYMSYKKENGIPIGAALIDNLTHKIIGVAHNERIQKNSPTLHGETSCLENCGRLKASVYKNCTLYTTLSPCIMCTGTVLLYGIKRIVVGEKKTFEGEIELLEKRGGCEVIVTDDKRCIDIMDEFIKEKPEVWNEDIGEED